MPIRPTARTRIALVIGTLAAATALAGCVADPAASEASASSIPASAIDVVESNTVPMTRLSATSALAAAEAALASCQEQGVGFVTVAVVDRFGQPQALVRGDNAAVHTIEAAQQKAYTSAAFGANTSDLVERATGDGPNVSDLPGTLFLAGGVPVKVGEATIAGIGVGGAPSGDVDQSCAAAGAAVLEAELTQG